MQYLLPILTTLSPLVLATSLTVTLDSGKVNGALCTNTDDAAFYKGIPYALPPVGSLRFAPPQPFTQQYADGSLNATQPSPSCIQFGTQLPPGGAYSEDCLYLDVYTPANATLSSGSKLPVRVWLYGGSNTNGGISDPLFDGCAAAAGTDAILVNVNYRLGALGFLALPQTGIGGNQAIQDQLLALKWVQDNIEAFGGDPDKVVLYGQSAGASDAFLISTLPQAPELFSSVVLESGGGRDFVSCSTAYEVWSAYAKALECPVDEIDCLASKPVAELVTAFENLPILNTGLGHFPGLGLDGDVLATSSGPFVDGKIVPAQPAEVGVQVPSIFGFASQDGAIFAATAFANPLSISQKNYTDFLTQSFGNTTAQLIEKYIPFSAFAATGAPGFAAIEYVYTLWQYQCPAYRGLNKAAQKGLPSWAYDFNHTLTCPWIPSVPKQGLKLLGPTHTSEIPFVFEQTSHLPAPNGTCSFNHAEVKLAKFISQAWTNMAEMQRPTAHGSVWPAYKGPKRSKGVTFNDSPVAGPIDFSVCKLFDQIRDAQLALEPNAGCASTQES